MESVIIIPVAIVAIFLVGVIGLGGMRLMRRQQLEHQREVTTGQVESLRYEVPTGQDPAAVMSALKLEGYDVVREDAPTRFRELVVLCPAGADRERARVRAVIAHEAPVDMEGHPMPEHAVHFADER
jgi:hypothetical protein